jgi:peptidyl-prolyl cis-trans isomerase C
MVSLASGIYAEEDVMVAKIGDKKIMMSDLQRIISYHDEKKKKLLEANPELQKILLQRMVKSEVIARIARERGFDRRPDIKEFVQFLINDYIATEFLNREIIKESDIKDEDIFLYYKTHLDEFKTPELVKARHILIKVKKDSSEEERLLAKERAEDILKRIKSGEDFEKLVVEFSDDNATKSKGGSLGYIKKGMMVPDFEKVLFSLKPGEVSEVVKSRFGYHIIKVDEKKEPELEPFDKVKNIAKAKVIELFRNSKATEFVEKVLKEAGVEFYLDRIGNDKNNNQR